MINTRLAFMSAIGIGSFAYRTGSYFPYLDYYLKNSKLWVGDRPHVIVPRAGTLINLTKGSGKVASPREEQFTFNFPGKLLNFNQTVSQVNGTAFPYFYAIVLKYYGQGSSGRV